MLTRPQSVYKNTLTGVAGVAVTNAQTVEDKVTLTRQQRRLAGIDLRVRLTTSGVAFTTTESIVGIIKAIRLYLNDITNDLRPAIDVKGPEILQFVANCEVFLDRFTEQAFAFDVTGLTTSYAYEFFIFIPCFDPELGEKAIPFQSVPLYALKENAVLQVDIGTAADIGATGGVTGNIIVDWKPCYRLEDVQRPYIPWRINTYRETWGKTGQNQHDFIQDGFLTKFQVSNRTSATIGARGTILTGALNYELKIGQTSIDVFTDSVQIAKTDRSRRSYPQGTTFAAAPTAALAYRNMPASWMYSLIKDPVTGEAFGVQSAIDLRVKPQTAERVSLFLNDVNAIGNISDITEFRLLPYNDDDLKYLYGGV